MLSILFASIISVCFTAQPQMFTYKTIDNLNIEAAVYAPVVAAEDKFPVVFAIHGGAYLLGSYTAAFSTQELEEMLTRGWVVVSIHYRLGPYYFLPDIVEDVIDAYNWVHNDLANIIPINPDAIAIWGDSAGAGLTVIAGYKVTPRPKAIVAFYPYCTDFTNNFAYNPNTPVSEQLVTQANNLRKPTSKTMGRADSEWGLFERMQKEQKASWVLTTSDPNESPNTILATMKEYSVVYHIDVNYPPTYLIHGLQDDIVPISESVQMADVLRRKNMTYKLDLVPGAGHTFDLDSVSKGIWQKHLLPVFDFVEKYIGRPRLINPPVPPSNFIVIIIIVAVIIVVIVMAGIYFIKTRKYIKLQESFSS